MQSTNNYGLKKPEGTDYVNIEDLNYNADVIDEKLKNNADAIEAAEGGLGSHLNANNPHGVTASDVGALPNTGGALKGALTANADAVADTTVKQVRNIYAGTEDMEAGVTELASGDIYVMYE